MIEEDATEQIRQELKLGLRPLMELQIGHDDLDIIPADVQAALCHHWDIRNEVDQIIGTMMDTPAARRSYLADNAKEMIGEAAGGDQALDPTVGLNSNLFLPISN